MPVLLKLPFYLKNVIFIILNYKTITKIKHFISCFKQLMNIEIHCFKACFLIEYVIKMIEIGENRNNSVSDNLFSSFSNIR